MPAGGGPVRSRNLKHGDDGAAYGRTRSRTPWSDVATVVDRQRVGVPGRGVACRQKTRSGPDGGGIAVKVRSGSRYGRTAVQKSLDSRTCRPSSVARASAL